MHRDREWRNGNNAGCGAATLQAASADKRGGNGGERAGIRGIHSSSQHRGISYYQLHCRSDSGWRDQLRPLQPDCGERIDEWNFVYVYGHGDEFERDQPSVDAVESGFPRSGYRAWAADKRNAHGRQWASIGGFHRTSQ
jgi:hypothetical protein